MKKSNKPRITIIGAGITGLMTGLNLYKDYSVTIIDAGPDPRKKPHRHGATYSGMDARHVSLAETAPWTYEHRHDLIAKNVREGGWMCIPTGEMNDLEVQWIRAFQDSTKDKKEHDTATASVMKFNADGVARWEKLRKKYDFITPIVDTTDLPMIARSKTDMMDEFEYDSDIYDKTTMHDGEDVPKSLQPLQHHLTELGGYGYYTTYGVGYHAKTVCNKCIEFLEKNGVTFSWDTCVSSDILEEKPDERTYISIDSLENADAIIWCAGVSHHGAQVLSKYGILVQGVMGCWVAIENPGVHEACKIYGPEPINYMNLTPAGDQLLLSGGYGFVGTRDYDEAVSLAEPLMNVFVTEVKRWLPDARIIDQSFCIRPSTPSGLPAFVTHHTTDGTPILIAAAHAAGGYTQAPSTAYRVTKELKKII